MSGRRRRILPSSGVRCVVAHLCTTGAAAGGRRRRQRRRARRSTRMVMLLLPLSVSRREGGRRGCSTSLPSVLWREGGGVGCSGAFSLAVCAGAAHPEDKTTAPTSWCAAGVLRSSRSRLVWGPRRPRFRGHACVARKPLAAARGADSGKQFGHPRCADEFPGVAPFWLSGRVARSGGRGGGQPEETLSAGIDR